MNNVNSHIVPRMICDLLIACAVGFCPGGKKSMTTMKDTHATAIAPTGVAQCPRLNGPGTNLSLPEVMRRKIGAAYDV